MTGKIFISYRRGDDPGFTLALFQKLEQAFSVENVFMDVEHMPAGEDFVKVLSEQVASCDVLLAVIGKNWLSARDEAGRRRLDNPQDFVRIEIHSALTQGKHLIPVMLNDTPIPRGEDLPEAIAPLARRHALRIRFERFKPDAEGIARAITEALEKIKERKAQAAKEAEFEAARRKAEEEARAEEEAEREKERLRLEAIAGLSPNQIAKAEELANWDFIKERGDAEDLRDHLARFPDGITQRYTQDKLEEILWLDLRGSSDIAALQAYFAEFPQSRYEQEVREQLRILKKKAEAERLAAQKRRRETSDWGRIAASTDQSHLESFLRKWPKGQYAEAAKARLKELKRGGGMTRRHALKVFGIGAVGAATGGMVLYSAAVPGKWLWQQINDQSIRTFSGHAGSVYTLAFSPDGRFIRSVSNGTLKFWDAQTGREISSWSSHSGGFESAVSPDGRFILSAMMDHTLKLWDVQTGHEISSLSSHSDLVTATAFSPESRFALSGSFDKTLKLWDAQIGREIRTFTGHSGVVNTVAFSPDGRYIISGSGDKTLKLWDAQTGHEIHSFSGHSAWVDATTFSPDGRYIISGGEDTTLKLWDVQTGHEIRTFSGHAGSVYTLAFSPDGRFVLSGSYDKTLKLWDAQTGREVRTFSGHSGSVFAVAFSPDGRYVLSGSSDKTLKLWDVSEWTQAN